MILFRTALLAGLSLALTACGGGSAREIRIVGSSTVFPFTTAVAEAFVNQGGGRKAPVVESIGTGAGIKSFCDGAGWQYPDVVNASRRMKKAEYAACQAKGVGEVIEVQIGVDGVALAESNAGPKLRLTKRQVYLALAANPYGKPNATRLWSDVDSTLPAIPIQVMGPPATSGTRDALAELILEPGCIEADPLVKKLEKAQLEDRCRRIRDDGPYVDKGENDNLIVQGLSQNPNALGVFGYSYLEENHDRLHGVPIEGVAPSYATIASGSYPGARPLYLYVKKRHLRAVPGLADFLALYTTMWNPQGKLVRRGLIAARHHIPFLDAGAVEVALQDAAGDAHLAQHRVHRTPARRIAHIVPVVFAGTTGRQIAIGRQILDILDRIARPHQVAHHHPGAMRPQDGVLEVARIARDHELLRRNHIDAAFGSIDPRAHLQRVGHALETIYRHRQLGMLDDLPAPRLDLRHQGQKLIRRDPFQDLVPGLETFLPPVHAEPELLHQGVLRPVRQQQFAAIVLAEHHIVDEPGDEPYDPLQLRLRAHILRHIAPGGENPEQ